MVKVHKSTILQLVQVLNQGYNKFSWFTIEIVLI
jgi:hypothetical protein